jgi:hypothetical protein
MKSTITIEEAMKLRYKELFLTYQGIGDNIALYFAAETYYKINGQKLLLSMQKNIKCLFENKDYAYFLDGFSCVDMSTLGCDERRRVLSHYGINPVFVSSITVRELNNGTGKNVVQWPDKHILAKYCERVGFTGQTEILPHIVLTDKEKKYGRFYQKNQIAIVSSGLLRYKTWPLNKTQSLVNKLKKQYHFVQIGQPSDPKIKGCLDKRRQRSLREVASILYNSDLFVGGIGGLVHLARSVNCRAVVAHSSAEPLYESNDGLTTYCCYDNVKPRDGCNICGLNLRDPQHQVCFNSYSCINNVQVEDMVEAIHRQMQKVREKIPLEISMVDLKADKAISMDIYHAMSREMYNPDSFMLKRKNKFRAIMNFWPMTVTWKILRKIYSISVKILMGLKPVLIIVEEDNEFINKDYFK